MNKHIKLSVTTLLAIAPLGVTFAEPGDAGLGGNASGNVLERFFRPNRSAPAPAPVAAPIPVTPAPAPVVVAPAPRPPVVVRPAVSTAPANRARRPNYTPPDTYVPPANNISSAPTINTNANRNPADVPQMSQREMDERLWLAALAGNYNIVVEMIDQGANPNIATNYGETAIHAAAARGHTQIVMYLKEHGGNIFARTTKGWTPLHHAARFGQTGVATYLIKQGANARHPTADGGRKTPLDLALDKNDLRMARILGY